MISLKYYSCNTTSSCSCFCHPIYTMNCTKIICNRNPLISPLITIPAFALHIGTNCGPCELRSLLDRDWCEGALDICLLGVSLGIRNPSRDLSDCRGVL